MTRVAGFVWVFLLLLSGSSTNAFASPALCFGSSRGVLSLRNGAVDQQQSWRRNPSPTMTPSPTPLSQRHSAVASSSRDSRSISATSASSKPIPSSSINSSVRSALMSGLASTLAMACCRALLCPFDTVKTLQQHYPSSPTNPAPSMLNAFRILLSRGGIPALYAGIFVSVVGLTPSMAVYFTLYDLIKRLGARQLSSDPSRGPVSSSSFSSLLIVCVAAGLANAVAAVFRVPSEVLKQRLQAGVDASMTASLSSIVWGNGDTTFFSRLGTLFPPGAISSQVARDVPYAVVTLLLYEYMRAVTAAPITVADGSVKKKGGSNSALGRSLLSLLCGAVAGGVGTIATHPLDVMKTRLQTAKGATVYAGWWDCAGKSVKGEGWSVLLRGSGSRLMHKVPANGLFFLFYEMFKKLFGVEV